MKLKLNKSWFEKKAPLETGECGAGWIGLSVIARHGRVRQSHEIPSLQKILLDQHFLHDHEKASIHPPVNK